MSTFSGSSRQLYSEFGTAIALAMIILPVLGGITAMAREIDGEFTVLEGPAPGWLGPAWSTRTRSCESLPGKARSFRATMAGRCD
jgi:hypothetical protein